MLAAASLSRAFDQIQTAFEADYPEIDVVVSYGPSGALARQIEAGAPVDVFASAGQPEMNLLQTRGLVAENQRRAFAANQLCLACSESLILDRWEDLSRPEVKRISIGGPTAPVGNYARELLEHRGLTETLAAKLIPGTDVRQVIGYLLKGEVDAALVYRTDALPYAKDGKLVISTAKAAPDDHSPIRYPIAVIAAAPQPDAARLFVDFVLGSRGQEILQANGFASP